jgi:hypothetical protein
VRVADNVDPQFDPHEAWAPGQALRVDWWEGITNLSWVPHRMAGLAACPR